MERAIQYPHIGVLLGTSFDKAVRSTLQSWPWILATVAVVAFGVLGNGSQQLLNITLLVWNFTAAANAMRTIDPAYRMNAGTVGGLLLAGIGAGLAVVIGLILLVLPGLYFATRFSVAQAAVLADRMAGGDGLSASWALTEQRFWRTFLFFAVLTIAVELAIFIPSFAIGGLAGALVRLKLLPITIEQAGNIGIVIAAPIAMYGQQAAWIGGLYWYQSLKAMRDAELAAA